MDVETQTHLTNSEQLKEHGVVTGPEEETSHTPITPIATLEERVAALEEELSNLPNEIVKAIKAGTAANPSPASTAAAGPAANNDMANLFLQILSSKEEKTDAPSIYTEVGKKFIEGGVQKLLDKVIKAL